MKTLEDLKKRVDQFNTLSLPGQPMGVHMGTSYLINDLWQATREQAEKIASMEDRLDHAGEALRGEDN